MWVHDARPEVGLRGHLAGADAQATVEAGRTMRGAVTLDRPQGVPDPPRNITRLCAAPLSGYISPPLGRRRNPDGRRSWCLGGHVFAVPRRKKFRAGSHPSPVYGRSVPRRLPRQPTGTTGYHGRPTTIGGPYAHGPPDQRDRQDYVDPPAHASGAAGDRGRTRRDTEIAGKHYVGRVHPLTTTRP